DARTPLIISGPVEKAGDETFIQYKPYVERLYNAQKNFVNQTLNEAKRLIAAGEITDKPVPPRKQAMLNKKGVAGGNDDAADDASQALENRGQVT
ncbi:MAG: hypothetical protein J6X19_02565, partial [Clostridia bacterium]|nr:hypothetical protein [Clostridia bacterium]